EARLLMLSAHNILLPASGRPVVIPHQDMVIGAYYLTQMRAGAKGEGKAFASVDEMRMAYHEGVVSLHARVAVRVDGVTIHTTPGRVILNEVLPEGMEYYNRVIDRKELARLVDALYRRLGNTRTAAVLDSIKKLGFQYATRSGTTVGLADVNVPNEKRAILDDAETQVQQIETQHRRGLLTSEERYQRTCDIWTRATDDVTKAMWRNLDPFNPVFMMANSGARGNINQLRQLAGMRGLVSDPTGRIIEIPIRANYREGLTVLEYFISTHGTRKGLADTALRTADSGYLTRRLVDVSQDVIVREEDCGTTRGIEVAAIVERTGDREDVIEPLRERIAGRVTADRVVHPTTGETIIDENQLIDEEHAAAIEDAGIKKVQIRSVLTCRSRYGVCVRCYGRNLASGQMVEIGEAVGIIAAQSIGEPGTQLTMRTFHTGGVAGADDITAGLPRVEELFEARKPKGQAIITESPGTVRVEEGKNGRKVVVAGEDGDRSYNIPYGSRLKVRDGESVEAGDQLTEGSVNPHDILRVRGLRGVQQYLVQEVQDVYRSQVDLNDKHIEIVVRQMLRKVKVDEAGDTDLLPGSTVDIFEFAEENERVEAAGGEPATAKPVLLGITKASLATESFLSAASFQETTRVLTDAAIKGKSDPLLGLKENVIIGKLIPAGTGMSRYRNIQVAPAEGVAPIDPLPYEDDEDEVVEVEQAEIEV
ncbi:MAG TPA: DNA-directed RNA polymerase subunit beta', partial [Limnochordia bacterium]|nr:DNA-directed RNA polymerase subunit beta' [Limnochordia bacterium]